MARETGRGSGRGGVGGHAVGSVRFWRDRLDTPRGRRLWRIGQQVVQRVAAANEIAPEVLHSTLFCAWAEHVDTAIFDKTFVSSLEGELEVTLAEEQQLPFKHLSWAELTNLTEYDGVRLRDWRGDGKAIIAKSGE